MNAHKKEVVFTILMTLAFLLTAHTGLIFSLFPIEGYMFGFPIMYIVPILLGWFGILFLTIISGKIGNSIDESIEKENQEEVAKQKNEGAV